MINYKFCCNNLVLPKIVFDSGSVNSLPEILQDFGVNRVLIVTDKFLGQTDIISRIKDLISEAGYDVTLFDRVEADPEIRIAEDCIQACRESDAELVIGVGGGSSLDIAKVAAALQQADKPIRSYFGKSKIEQPGLPSILIPTTAGTGSEVAIASVLSDKEEKLKKGILSPYLLCDTVVLDPELTLSCPPRVTAASGIDALTHAIEVYTNKMAVPFTDFIVLGAIQEIGKSLKHAYLNGADLNARSAMLLASMHAGIGMQLVNNAAVHALSSPLGALYNIPHGAANTFLLPYVMKFNRSSCVAKYAKIATALGKESTGDEEKDSYLAIEAVVELSKELKVMDQLKELEVKKSDISKMAELSLKVWLMDNNPRKVTKEDAESIYEDAFKTEGVSII